MRKLTAEQYEREIEKAFNWYDRYIAYSPTRLEVELVELKGRYAPKTAIKIPVEKDTREFRQTVEEFFASIGKPISIRKFVFTSEYSSYGEPRKYRTYLYRPADQ